MQAVGLRTCLPPVATQPGAEAGKPCTAHIRCCLVRPKRRSDLAAAAAAAPTHRRPYRRTLLAAAAASGGDAGGPGHGSTDDERVAAAAEKLAALADLNQLQTALNTAISAEDWALAAKLRDVLRLLTGAEGQGGSKLASDWKGLGILPWLAERAENLGYTFPTGGRELRLWAGGAGLHGQAPVLPVAGGRNWEPGLHLPPVVGLGVVVGWRHVMSVGRPGFNMSLICFLRVLVREAAPSRSHACSCPFACSAARRGAEAVGARHSGRRRLHHPVGDGQR